MHFLLCLLLLFMSLFLYTEFQQILQLCWLFVLCSLVLSLPPSLQAKAVLESEQTWLTEWGIQTGPLE